VTDIVTLAVIAGVPAVLTSGSALLLGILNRGTINQVSGTISQVKTNTDGNLAAMKSQIAALVAANTAIAAELSQAKENAAERERSILAGDAKFAEGVNAEKRLQAARSSDPKSRRARKK
jgi:hypothetical protein